MQPRGASKGFGDMNTVPRRVSQCQFCGSRGQGMLEYSLVFLMIVLVVVGALTLIGPAVAQALSGVAPAL